MNGSRKIGGRGSYSADYGKSGGISPENRKYSEVGRIGNIKVIQSDETSNNHTPTYSNTKNTTYFAYSKERDRIEEIYYYRNHRLVKSVDLGKKAGEKPHVHYWSPSGMVGRKRHDKRNTFELSDRDKRLMNMAKGFHLNKKQNGKKNSN